MNLNDFNQRYVPLKLDRLIEDLNPNKLINYNSCSKFYI